VQPGQRILPDLEERWQAARKAAEGKLERLVERESEGHDVEIVQRILLGVPYREIATYAAEIGADLLVMVSRGRHGLTQKMLGSVAERVIRLVTCPVLTVPPASEGFDPRHVMVATDLSPCSDRALPVARFLADTCEATFSLLHVLPPRGRPGALPDTGPPPTMTEEYWSHLRESAKGDLEERSEPLGNALSIELELTEARDPGAEIVDRADREGVDLIVVGTRGHTGVTRLLLGSTAEKVVREADCAVLTVTPEFFADASDAEAGSAAALDTVASA
jgi:nucleotide-binding universal stress UspA family protein